jgi:hypothetical protein
VAGRAIEAVELLSILRREWRGKQSEGKQEGISSEKHISGNEVGEENVSGRGRNESFFSYAKLMFGGLAVKSTLQKRQTVGNNPP